VLGADCHLEYTRVDCDRNRLQFIRERVYSQLAEVVGTPAIRLSLDDGTAMTIAQADREGARGGVSSVALVWDENLSTSDTANHGEQNTR
jgi:hypothetical protein